MLKRAKLLLRREFMYSIVLCCHANCNSDNANFINFCTGQTLTNGLQVKQGSCNGIRKYMGILHSEHWSDLS